MKPPTPERGADPNEGRNDPMVPEYWLLGEAVQDAIISAGYEAETVEGVAVDIHDLLQAADHIRAELGPRIVAAGDDKEALIKLLAELKFEFEHIRWHCDDAVAFLNDTEGALGAGLGETPAGVKDA